MERGKSYRFKIRDGSTGEWRDFGFRMTIEKAEERFGAGNYEAIADTQSFSPTVNNAVIILLAIVNAIVVLVSMPITFVLVTLLMDLLWESPGSAGFIVFIALLFVVPVAAVGFACILLGPATVVSVIGEAVQYFGSQVKGQLFLVEDRRKAAAVFMLPVLVLALIAGIICRDNLICRDAYCNQLLASVFRYGVVGMFFVVQLILSIRSVWRLGRESEANG